LKQNSDEETLQKSIQEFLKVSGLASNDRQKLIKAAIRVIIENIVPPRVRILLKITETQTNPSLEDIKKLFKLDKKRFEVEVKDPKFDEIDRLHYHCRVDAGTNYRIRNNFQEVTSNVKLGFQDCIHDLIRVRNKIFNWQLRYKR
jgi:hypothetical protein